MTIGWCRLLTKQVLYPTDLGTRISDRVIHALVLGTKAPKPDMLKTLATLLDFKESSKGQILY